MVMRWTCSNCLEDPGLGISIMSINTSHTHIPTHTQTHTTSVWTMSLSPSDKIIQNKAYKKDEQNEHEHPPVVSSQRHGLNSLHATGEKSPSIIKLTVL